MKAVPLLPLLGLGLATCVVAELAGIAALASVDPREPFVVVAPPWRGGAERVVEAAGGRVVGPVRAPLSVLAAGAAPDSLSAAGAWLVLDAARLASICGSEKDEW